MQMLRTARKTDAEVNFRF